MCLKSEEIRKRYCRKKPRMPDGKPSIQIRYRTVGKDLNAFKSWLLNNPVTIQYHLKNSIEEPLTSDQLQALKQLSTYYPETNIFPTSDQLEPYMTCDYPVSMENGWNYVKKQLGDTREYIYDMDARVSDTEVTTLENKIDTAILTAMMEA